MEKLKKQKNKNERIERRVYIYLAVLYALMFVAVLVSLCL
jgi:hypothetical protein